MLDFSSIQQVNTVSVHAILRWETLATSVSQVTKYLLWGMSGRIPARARTKMWNGTSLNRTVIARHSDKQLL